MSVLAVVAARNESGYIEIAGRTVRAFMDHPAVRTMDRRDARRPDDASTTTLHVREQGVHR